MIPRKIAIMGTSGAGKTMFAAEVARRLDLACIELDALHWGPNWRAATVEEFRKRVLESMASASAGWVIDGNYTSKLGETVIEAADTIVWLDLPFPIKFYRLFRRTVTRAVRGVELWNGNRESWRESFASRDSLFLWMIRSHRRQRREWPVRFTGDRRLVRIRSSAEARRWLSEQSPAQRDH